MLCDVVGGESDVDFARLACGGVEGIDVAAFLKHDGVAVGRGELDVEVGEVGHFLGFACEGVVGEEIHGHIAVGDEENLVADPHRGDVLGGIGGDVGHGAFCGVVDPDVVGHSATIIFPGAEFAHHAVVGHALSVGRERAEASFGQRYAGGHGAVCGGFPELAVESVADAVSVDNRAVGRPAHGDVVGAHAVAQVVARISRGVCDAARFATAGVHKVYFGVAVVLSGEGYLPAVGREAWENLVAHVGSEAACLAACEGRGVEVAGVAEHHVAAVGGREPEQPCLVAGRSSSCLSSGCGEQRKKGELLLHKLKIIG